MKKLIICDTNYQLFVAIQLKLTLFAEECVDIWVSDHSRNMEKVCNNLREVGYFDNVKYINTKTNAYNTNVKKIIMDVISYGILDFYECDVDLYEEIIFYGIDLNIYGIYNYYSSIGHHVVWSRFEEGLFSYETDFSFGRRVKLTKRVREMLRKTDICNQISRYYCFFPELKMNKWKWDIIGIPQNMVCDKEFVNNFNKIYNYIPSNIPQKYIFFASATDIEGNPYGETELVLELVEKYGKQNFLVKMHPRDNRNVYEQNGISVMRESFIPWEVMQLNMDMNDKMLLTSNSGAFISICAICGTNVSAKLMLGRIKSENKALLDRNKNICRIIDNLHSIGVCKNISVE